MKKLLFCVCCLLILSGCSEFNEKLNDSQSWEKEKEYCSNGKKIWVLERGNDERINITSQIVGECELE
ncbi:hypothetical protein [Amedibacterium intestinale]|jgi:hypothetical protein|uniref:hypothetical protein n=1 Tax=Amedibacterium intestinale TaxID=2583452 RepID=UPI000E1FEF4B